MKKLISILLALVLATVLFAGCEKSGGTVSTDGSTSMGKVIGALGEAFMQNNSGVTFTYQLHLSVADNDCHIKRTFNFFHVFVKLTEYISHMFYR